MNHVYSIRPSRGAPFTLRTTSLAADLRRALTERRITCPIRITPLFTSEHNERNAP
jgi:hypothetical protein